MEERYFQFAKMREKNSKDLDRVRHIKSDDQNILVKVIKKCENILTYFLVKIP